MNLAIYGAQGYALGAYEALKALYPRRNICSFLVSAMGNNARELSGVPVQELAQFAQCMTYNEKRNIEILIATPENVQPEIEENIENYGFPYHCRLDSRRWAELMKLYHVKLGHFLPLSALPVGYHKPFTRIYMAKSHKDRPLKNCPVLADYIYPIQVGAANAEFLIADLADNRGENISLKNANYSELTGLYWIWKNKLSLTSMPENEKMQYFGFVQYRRVLDLSEDDLLRLADNDVDVLLPYPLPYEPNIHAHHERYLKEADWHALLTVLKELQPGYASRFPEILEQKYMYNYNIILAKKRVLREYCEWLFPILERVEELSVPREGERSDRYIGYMGEALETLYFLKNAEKLNVVHTYCKFFT